jgi:hypothetical protein
MPVGFSNGSTAEEHAVIDARWEAYLYERHARSELAAWAPTLRYFRYCRAYGGHANDGDTLLASISIQYRSALESVLRQLGIPLVILPPDNPTPEVGVSYRGDQFMQFQHGIKQFPDIKQPGHVRLSDVAAHVWVFSDRLTISLADEDNAYEVTAPTIASAHRVEMLLEPLAALVIDPPQDNKHCICPKFYPELWPRHDA